MVLSHKLPPEMHKSKGTTGQNQGTFLPDSIKKRIPFAEWADNPDQWDKRRFIDETAKYLDETYGLGCEQDKHTLVMMADQLEIYVHARTKYGPDNMIIKINAGKTLAPNPYVAIANKAMDNFVKLAGEFGLTPRSRLASNKTEDDTAAAKFMKGWMGSAQ